MTTTIRVRCPKCSSQFDTSTRSDRALCQICGTLSERVACERAAAKTVTREPEKK